MDMFTLSSDAFSDGEVIPRKYGYKNGNYSPPLKINGVPENAVSLVLIMDDPDAMKAVGKVWVHWVLWNISPQITEFQENSIPSESIEGKTDFGENGYGGPAPPDRPGEPAATSRPPRRAPPRGPPSSPSRGSRARRRAA